MNNIVILTIIPFITAAIGWLTNWIAIKMLFYPRKAIYVTIFKWQGLIPRRQQKLAEQAAEVIEREILQQQIITHEIRKIDLTSHLENAAKTIVWERIGPQIKAIPLIGSFITESTLANFEVIAAESIKKESNSIVRKVASEFERSVNLKQIIQDNIATFDLDRLESIVKSVARKEFSAIERFGALLGFIIGCLQVVLFVLTGMV